jgi:hypothetical protein
MGFVSSGSEVTLRILAVAAGRRRRGIGRARLRAFEASALRLGATRISLGADAEAGFYIRHGYQTMLLLQWAYAQLFVDLDESSPVVRAQVQDMVCGAHVGYCMTKAIRAQNEQVTLGLG